MNAPDEKASPSLFAQSATWVAVSGIMAYQAASAEMKAVVDRMIGVLLSDDADDAEKDMAVATIHEALFSE